MPFYAFRLDSFTVKYPRSKGQDNDLVTFGVFVNQIDRGHGAAMFNDLAAGAMTPAAAVAPTTAHDITKQWIIGPFEIAPGDGLNVVYSGTNLSDDPNMATAQQEAQVEIKILDSITNAVIGAAGLGTIGAAVGGVLGFAGDPIGKLLGWTPQGPCDDAVFSDAVAFTGSGISTLPFSPPAPQHVYTSLPDSVEYSFTHSYTDETTHDATTCGHIAETDVQFSVLQVSSVSVKYYMGLFYPGKALSKGLLQFAAPHTPFSLRSLLHLRP